MLPPACRRRERVLPACCVRAAPQGILLYGPPGTGKTLIARQLAKILNGKEPKIVNGPEVLNKYVGQSEENIRNLFAEADAEYREKGDASELHIIIFDEIDAVCKSRGSVRDGSGVHDTVVNQLLTKIDGVDALNNVLLIGMTNRKDMLDEALLRPGRLEVHIEVGLPDERGRLQILHIHTSKVGGRAGGWVGAASCWRCVCAGTRARAASTWVLSGCRRAEPLSASAPGWRIPTRALVAARPSVHVAGPAALLLKRRACPAA